MIEPSGSASTISSSGWTFWKNRVRPVRGTGGADADDDGVEIVAGLRPELRAGAALVGQQGWPGC